MQGEIMLNRLHKRYTHEDLFLERYDQLLAWAVRLTDHDLQLAEDLVHDVFVKFALTQPDLQRVENLDAYLYTSLRNTYRSQVRRVGYNAVRHVSLIDFDSADLGLRRVEHRHAFQVQEELRLICRYGCIRKESSKAGSVLLLRFFLGYFPSEIAKLLKCQRQPVAELLRVARVEARRFVDDPKRLGFVDQDRELESIWGTSALPTEDLLAALKRQIFSTCSGECLSRDQWREQYSNDKDLAIDRLRLAHLVSCPHCLEKVNKILGLPSLEDRNPTDSTGHDPGSKDGSRGGNHEALNRIRRRVKQVYEHDPKELRIVVNGRLIASQTINAEVNKQRLTLSELEPITFVEVYSEQDLRLAYLVVDRLPVDEFEQQETIQLSDERRIEINLNFKEICPELQVIFYQPQVAASSLLTSEEIEESVESERADWWMRLKDWIGRRWFGSLLTVPQGIAALAILLIAVWFIISYLGRPTATSLLDQVTRVEESSRATVAAEPGQVFHRTIDVEELRPDHSIVARRRIEVWQNARKQLEVRRLYDENGRLLASNSKAIPESNDGLGKDKRFTQMPTLDDLCRLDLSAKEFLGLVDNVAEGAVEETPQAYVVSYQNPSAGMVKASLTIDRRDKRAIEQRFVFRYANEDRIVRFAEKLFERRPLDTSTEPIFENVSELRDNPSKRGNAVTSSQSLPVTPVAPGAAIITTSSLEVKALTLLHQIGADLGEEVTLTRGSDGKLKIEAIVETKRRKNEILKTLAPIAGHPAMVIHIETVAEALQQRTGGKQQSTPSLIQEYDTTAREIPAQAELQGFFARKLGERSGDPVDKEMIESEIRKFTNNILRRSQRALLSGYALKRLVDRFSPDELRAFDTENRASWHSLIAAHAHNLAVETAAMRALLQPMVDNPGDDTSPVSPLSKDDAGLLVAIKRLFELETVADRSIRSAFIASTQANGGSPVKTIQIWRDLLRVEKLSSQIHQQLSK